MGCSPWESDTTDSCNLKNKQNGFLGKLRHQDAWGAGWKAPLAVVLRGGCLCFQA